MSGSVLGRLSAELSEELEVSITAGRTHELALESPGTLLLEASAFSDARRLSLATGDCLLWSGWVFFSLAALRPFGGM